MEFDLVTFIAQVVNFLILMYFLNKFLFGKIIDAMNERKAKITNELEEAKLKMAEAKKLYDLNEEKLLKFDSIAQNIKLEAINNAAKEEERLLEDAKMKYEIEQKKWNNRLESEKEEINRTLVARAQKMSVNISKKILYDLSDEHLEEKIIKKFILNLKDEELENAFKQDTENEVIIKTSFSISDDIKEKLENKLSKFSKFYDISYEIVLEEFFGIELAIGNFKVEWSMEEYIKTFEKEFI